MDQKDTIRRTIGVEIECYTEPLEYSEREAIGALGAVVDGDGSLDAPEDREAIEVKTSPHKGAEAEEHIRDVCEVLNRNGADVNASCGLHIHADGSEIAISGLVWPVNAYARLELKDGEKLLYVHGAWADEVMNEPNSNENSVLYAIVDLVQRGTLEKARGRYGDGYIVTFNGTPRALKTSAADGMLEIPEAHYGRYKTYVVRLQAMGSVKVQLFDAMRFFGAIDPLLRQFIPASRRRNSYCRPFEKMARVGGRVPAKLSDLYASIVDRYCGINLQALHGHGTIECRYHSGTTNPDKIIHWARLWARCVDIALSGSAASEADAIGDVVSTKAKTDMLFALLALPEDTETYLRGRIKAFAASDANNVKSYINNKKAQVPTIVCAA